VSDRLTRYVRHLMSFAGQRAVSAGVNFFLIAFLIRKLGAEGYGIWAIALSLGSYLGLVDLNTNASVVKYTAQLVAEGRRDELAPMVNAGVQILFGFSFGLLLLALLGLPWITPLIFKTADYTAADLLVLSALCMLSFAVLQTGNVYAQVLQGLLRQDEVNAIGAFGIAANGVAVVALVLLHVGVVGLGVANPGSNLLIVAATRLRVRALAPELPWLPFRSTPAWRKSLLRFSAGSYAFILWGWFYFTVPKLVLANQLGPLFVGFFDVGTKLAAQGRNFVQTLSQYLIPFLSDAEARDGAEKVRALQVRALTIIWMVGLGVAGFLLALRFPLVMMLEKPLPQNAGPALAAVFWVLIEYTAGGLAMPWVHFALAEDRLRHARPFLAFIIPACVLGPVAGLIYGPAAVGGVFGRLAGFGRPLSFDDARFAGFLMGGALANAAGSVLFYVLAVRERRIPALALAWRLGRVALGCALGLAFLRLVGAGTDASAPGAGHARELLSLAGAGLLWMAVLAAAWTGLGLYDRDLAGRLWGKLRRRAGA